MEWSYKEIRKRAFATAFKKGAGAWLMLLAVAFIFSFIGASNESQTTFIDSMDNYILENDPMIPESVDLLKDYAVKEEIDGKIPFLNTEQMLLLIDGASNGATWFLKLLATNIAYLQRNEGEVIVMIVIMAIIAAITKFFILNVVVVGKNRFVMENRFEKNVSLHRIVSPFHRRTLPNVTKVMFLYNLSIYLWSLTIIGGYYKTYQYAPIPYLIAENPNMKWKDAKALAKEMTKGYKWKMFLTQLSFIYIWILEVIPVVGLLVSVPLEMTLSAEFYFTLRNSGRIKSDLLIEDAFSGPAYVDMEPAKAAEAKGSEYKLQDLTFVRFRLENVKMRYKVTDFIFMFFTFCLIGWLWECGLHLFRHHEFVNRGTMYGPWIPIYGVGGVLIIFLLDRFRENKLKLLIMIVSLCAVLEYLTSFILDIMFNSSYWNYKNDFMNVNGRICFAGLAAFGIGGMAGIYILGPAIAEMAGKLSRKKQIIISVALCVLFVLDFICCMIFGFNSGAGVGGNI